MLYHFVLAYVLEIRPCGGASMMPTLSNSGDWIMHSPLLLRLSPVASLRGSLVTAVSPLDPGAEVLKRVIGVEGDTVLVDPSGERRGAEEAWVRVPKGHVWLAGDNASNSTDSRDYGPVPRGLLKGKVVGRVSQTSVLGTAGGGRLISLDRSCGRGRNGWTRMSRGSNLRLYEAPRQTRGRSSGGNLTFGNEESQERFMGVGQEAQRRNIVRSDS